MVCKNSIKKAEKAYLNSSGVDAKGTEMVSCIGDMKILSREIEEFKAISFSESEIEMYERYDQLDNDLSTQKTFLDMPSLYGISIIDETKKQIQEKFKETLEERNKLEKEIDSLEKNMSKRILEQKNKLNEVLLLATRAKFLPNQKELTDFINNYNNAFVENRSDDYSVELYKDELRNFVAKDLKTLVNNAPKEFLHRQKTSEEIDAEIKSISSAYKAAKQAKLMNNETVSDRIRIVNDEIEKLDKAYKDKDMTALLENQGVLDVFQQQIKERKQKLRQTTNEWDRERLLKAEEDLETKFNQKIEDLLKKYYGMSDDDFSKIKKSYSKIYDVDESSINMIDSLDTFHQIIKIYTVN